MDASNLIKCNQFALGLTINDVNEILILVTMGEEIEPTHVVTIPVEQSFQVATSFAMLAAEAGRLTEELENSPDPVATVKAIRERFSAGLN